MAKGDRMEDYEGLLITDINVSFGKPISSEDEGNLINDYISKGWKIDNNDENELAFSFYQDEGDELFKTFNKKTGQVFCYNGRQVANIRMIDEEENG